MLQQFEPWQKLKQDPRYLRSIQTKTRRDRVRNEEIRKEVGVCKLQVRMETVKVKWFEHGMRTSEETILKKSYKETMTAKKDRGRPRERWNKLKQEDLRAVQCSCRSGGKSEGIGGHCYTTHLRGNLKTGTDEENCVFLFCIA